MKYYTIEELFTNGGGQFLVAVESDEDLNKIILEEKEAYKDSKDLTEIRYHECTERDYVKFQEVNIVMHAKSYFYDTLEVDGNLPIREYNKIKYAPGNETKAVEYYQRRVAAFDRLRKKLNLEKISAKEFLDAVEAEATNN